MPIYEYRCECGATFESLESFGTTRTRCAELCQQKAAPAAPAPHQASAQAIVQASAPTIAPGEGRLERLLSVAGLRGTGHEASAPVFDPVKRANRPGCDDCGTDN